MNKNSLIPFSEKHSLEITIKGSELFRKMASTGNVSKLIPGSEHLDLGALSLNANNHVACFAPKVVEHSLVDGNTTLNVSFFETKELTEHYDADYDHSLTLLDMLSSNLTAKVYLGGENKPMPIEIASAIASIHIGNAILQISVTEE